MRRKSLVLCTLAACLIALSGTLRAQWVIHSVSGIAHPSGNYFSVTVEGGGNRNYTIAKKDPRSFKLPDSVTASAVAPASFTKAGANVVVFYYGYGSTATAVAVQDLGPGPFTYTLGTVTAFDRDRHTVSLHPASGEDKTFTLTDKTIVDAPSGVIDIGRFHPRKHARLRVTSSDAGGNATAVVIRSR